MKTKHKNFLVILCGGKSSRFGYQNKATIKYKGMSFIEIIIRNLEKLPIERIIISTKDILKDQIYSQINREDVEFVLDNVDFDGPLAGIISTFNNYEEGNFIFTPVDRIFVCYQDFLKFFRMGKLAIFAKVNDDIIPFPVFYNIRIKYLWNDFLKGNYGFSVKKWNSFVFKSLSNIDKCLVDFVNFDVNNKSLIDINSWQEYIAVVNGKLWKK